MDFRFQAIAAGRACKQDADALLVLLVGDAALPAAEPSLKAAADAAVSRGDFSTKPGRCLGVHAVPGLKAPRLVLAAAKPGQRGIKAGLASALGMIKSLGVARLAVMVVGAPTDAALAETITSAVGDAVYLYTHTKPSASERSRLGRVVVLGDKASAAAAEAGLKRGAAVLIGTNLARELANRPGNHCTPSHLADEVRKLGRGSALKVDVLERKDCEKLGMGSFLSVSRGSQEPPKFIVARWQGAGKGDAPVVLVGKGITFDTGGISLKPAAEMDEMKYDMGGAASVIGTLAAVAAMKARVNLVVLIPACENMPGGAATKPGDVVTSLSGQTIEILNTDAEGRLILCDALTYAERFKPAAVVDIATLTGACVIALGHVRSGLFTPDDQLADQLLAAGEAALDPAWRMPVDDEYDDALKSSYADMANVGPRGGGAITAAMFLKRFAGKFRWAHLDVAGTAWKSGAAKGGTGRPVGLLTHFVLSQAKA